MAYTKVYLKGGASVKTTEYGDIYNVNINVDDMMEKIRSKELKVSDMGNISFSIMKRNPENVKEGESTHYLCQSVKIKEDEAKAATEEDLPF